ncbi:acyltransferase [Candidatus Pelagibacter sp.]|nr:acyltransferase [Candidatus Pelagibacter sp.]
MKIQYRPEIDGLRAISVISVILYHLEIFINSKKIINGGFIGVDIFFVISGYLITSIIYKEILLTNKLSILNFYERRIRRIIPVLLTVCISYLIASYIYSLPTPLWKSAESVLASTFFLGNFYFLNERVEYGNEISNLEPFLHTWSLSIEEQYYIIFPIFFLFAYKYFRKYLIHILVLIFFLSLLLNNYSSRSWVADLNNISFYMLPFRGWEILSGCILAILENKIKLKKIPFSSIIPKVSFFIILFAIIFLDFEKTKPFPQLFIVVLSTIGIIWFSNKNELIVKILSWPPLVKIGLISFSLYLWHYPVFALYRQIDIEDKLFVNPINKIILVFFVFLISFFELQTYRKTF